MVSSPTDRYTAFTGYQVLIISDPVFSAESTFIRTLGRGELMVIRLFNSVLRIADHHDASKIQTRFYRDSNKGSRIFGDDIFHEETEGSFRSFEHVVHLIEQADIQFLDHDWNNACSLYTHASKILERIPDSHEEHQKYCASQLAYLHFRLFHWKAAMTYYVKSREEAPKVNPIEDQSRDLMNRIAAARKGNVRNDEESYNPSCSWHH